MVARLEEEAIRAPRSRGDDQLAQEKNCGGVGIANQIHEES